MNEGLHPAREGFHPFQLLFLNEQTPLSSSELQPHPVQSHGYVSMATVSNWVHMGKQQEQKERARERGEKKRKFLLGRANLAEALTGITWADLLTEKFSFFYVALQHNVPMTTASLGSPGVCSVCPSLIHKQ